MTAVIIDERAYRLMMAHAIRFYDRPVMGLLVGTKTDDRSSITIRHCLPIIHSYPTKPLLDICLELTNLRCKELGDDYRVIAVYEGHELLTDKTLGANSKTIAEYFAEPMIIFTIDNSAIHHSNIKEPAVLAWKWSPGSKSNPDRTVSVSLENQEMVFQQCRRYHEGKASSVDDVVDIEEHLSDITKDWLNEAFI